MSDRHRLQLTPRGRRLRALAILIGLFVGAILIWWYDTTWGLGVRMTDTILVILQLLALVGVYRYYQHYRPRLQARFRLSEQQLRADVAWWRSVKTDSAPLDSDRIPVRRGSQTLALAGTKGVLEDRSQEDEHDRIRGAASDPPLHRSGSDAGRHLHFAFGAGRSTLVGAAAELRHLVRRLRRPAGGLSRHRVPDTVPSAAGQLGRHYPQYHANADCPRCVQADALRETRMFYQLPTESTD